MILPAFAEAASRRQVGEPVPTSPDHALAAPFIVCDVINCVFAASRPVAHAALMEAIGAVDVKQRLLTYGLFLAPSSPEELAVFQIAETIL